MKQLIKWLDLRHSNRDSPYLHNLPERKLPTLTFATHFLFLPKYSFLLVLKRQAVWVVFPAHFRCKYSVCDGKSQLGLVLEGLKCEVYRRGFVCHGSDEDREKAGESLLKDLEKNKNWRFSNDREIKGAKNINTVSYLIIYRCIFNSHRKSVK